MSGSRFLDGSSKKNNPLIRLLLIKYLVFFLKLCLKKISQIPLVVLGLLRQIYFSNFNKEYFRKELFTYGYEYYSFGKVINSKKLLL